jgi:hypothetical protein
MTVKDLKEGDFLTLGDWIFILSELREDAENSYLIIYHALWNGENYIVAETRPGIGHVNYNCETPGTSISINYATNQQRKEFCDKLKKRRFMKWDEVNNRLVSIYEP